MRVVGSFAAVVVAVSLSSGDCHAQGGVEADAQAAAEEAATEAAHDSGPNPLAVDPDLAIWTLVVFALLFAVLRKFAWPQIAAAIDERERQIAANIAAAAAQNQEARKLLAEHEAKLAAAAGEVRALLEEARRDADVTRKRIEEDGRKAAGEEIARATREIQRAKEGAIQELAVASANTAIELARKVVRDSLTNDQQSQLVRDALGKLAAATPSNN
jgi:F-type H+-transporting ATPase subunit b